MAKPPSREQPATRAAGIVPVRFATADAADSDPRFLLLRAYNYWDFPKGELEPGEAPLAAALREAAEETSLDDFRLRWGEAYIETERYGRGKIARYYLAEAPAGDVELPVSQELGRPEHHEFRWATAEQARALLNQRLRRVLDWAVERLDAGG
ncbi:NUDIX hydrolase [Thiohalocapsa halophila]|uniref:NUDIX hydrolase n=1 Tax=Thiohalocapsa halophila TaxID=69359 RepID=A0ABS1CPR2_9GAMM|nr:NUDIX domain-containing protein [Thiohalocapsa halophila]MBK1633818.1 NUDIX hydrolase [Thiohalocapsa halophila]